MESILDHLGVTTPTMAAPMAGGPSTPQLVAAAGAAGSFGFLAAGYRTPQQLADQITHTRVLTGRFGVNLFAPNPVPVDPRAFRSYAAALQPIADRFGLELSGAAIVEDDDCWQDKVDLLLQAPVPVVSFTFGMPDRRVVSAFQRAGTVTAQTVTSVDEARVAADLGVDVLVVQAAAAGGHWGTFSPDRPPEQLPLPDLVRSVRASVPLPLLAAGGIGTAKQVRAVLGAGAEAVVVGTVLLRCPESGASGVHKAAVADAGRGQPVLTRAFSGRPARGLPNAFIDFGDRIAPSGYPAVHHLTSPLRRAATEAGDPELVNLWAGTGFRHADDSPAAEVLTRLAALS